MYKAHTPKLCRLNMEVPYMTGSPGRELSVAYFAINDFESWRIAIFGADVAVDRCSRPEQGPRVPARQGKARL